MNEMEEIKTLLHKETGEIKTLLSEEKKEIKTLLSEEKKEIKTLLHGMEESAKQSRLVTSGMAVVSLAVAFTGVAIADPELELIGWAKWFIGIAGVYVVVIFIYFIRRWLALKIKAK